MGTNYYSAPKGVAKRHLGKMYAAGRPPRDDWQRDEYDARAGFIFALSPDELLRVVRKAGVVINEYGDLMPADEFLARVLNSWRLRHESIGTEFS